MRLDNPKSKIENLKSGFTLIELLVVVAIIAVLVSLLLPALGAARAKGQQTSCASRLHQSGMAMHMYANDYQDYIFLYSSWSPGVYEMSWTMVLFNDTYGTMLKDKAGLYLSDANAAVCPTQLPNKFDSKNYVYGVNLDTDTPEIPLTAKVVSVNGGTPSYYLRSLTKTATPDRAILLGDSVRAHPAEPASYGWQFFVLNFDPKLYSSQGYYWGVHTRHRGQANLLFMDGHMEGGGLSWMKRFGIKSVYNEQLQPVDKD
jgi:prepilin-type N-terminal cleavage/methylation domain-containing protein/prepilin-type processing-associated H-X9-DG protein